MTDKHGWYNWDQYQAIHESFIRRFMDYFIIQDRLRPNVTSDLVQWDGALICVGGIEIEVTMLQEVEYRHGQPQVRTSGYRYHVLRKVEGITYNLFRYDNVHTHAGHSTPHHRHRYDADGREILPVQHVGEEGWPTLVELISDAYGVWEQMQRYEER